MPSKQVTDRQKSTNAVVAAIDTHRNAAANAVASALAPYLRSGEAMPDVALLLALLGRGLSSSLQALVNADSAHIAELADDDPARRVREDAASTLRQECVDLREILTGLFGAAIASQVLPDAVPRDPVMLARHAQTIEDNLGRVTLPNSRIPGASLDKNVIIARIRSLRQTLENAIQIVAREAREAQATQSAKDSAMDSFDHTFSLAADVTSGLLRLAGMPDQAARLRPSTRRPGQSVAYEESAEPTPAAPANG